MGTSGAGKEAGNGGKKGAAPAKKAKPPWQEKNSMGTVRKLLLVRTLSRWPTRGYSSNPTPAAHLAPTRTIHPHHNARLAGSRLASLQPSQGRSAHSGQKRI